MVPGRWGGCGASSALHARRRRARAERMLLASVVDRHKASLTRWSLLSHSQELRPRQAFNMLFIFIYNYEVAANWASSSDRPVFVLLSIERLSKALSMVPSSGTLDRRLDISTVLVKNADMCVRVCVDRILYTQHQHSSAWRDKDRICICDFRSDKFTVQTH